MNDKPNEESQMNKNEKALHNTIDAHRKPYTTKPSDTPGHEHVVDADGESVIERPVVARIGASLPVGLIRNAYAKALANITYVHGDPAYPHGKAQPDVEGARAAAIKVGREILPTLDDERLLKIARFEATLRGWSHTGVTYHDEKCGGCGGEGSIVPGEGRPSRQCQHCRGDGFRPSYSVVEPAS